MTIKLSDAILAFCETKRIDEADIRRALRRGGMGKSTIDKILDTDNVNPIRDQVIDRLCEIIKREWKVNIYPEWFKLDELSEFVEKVESGQVHLTIPWSEGFLLPNGIYDSFRFAFGNPNKVSIEIIVVDGLESRTYYKKDQTGEIGCSVGCIMSNQGGTLIISSNATTDDIEKVRPRVLCVNTSANDRRYFGYFLSTSPVHCQPSVASLVLERRTDGITERSSANFVATISIEEFKLKYKSRAAPILYVLDIENSTRNKVARITSEGFGDRFEI